MASTSQWTCTTCAKTFSRKGDLTRHAQLHTGIKPHHCWDCGKSFSQFSGLKTHKNVHTRVKPFVCGMKDCTAAFGDPSSCARHRKETHRTVGAYCCPFPRCKSSIKRRSAFKIHLKKHKIDPEMVDIDAMAPPLLPRQSIARRRSIRQISPPPNFGPLGDIVPSAIYPNNALYVYHTPPDISYYPASETTGNGAWYPHQDQNFHQIEMPGLPSMELYTIDSPSSPPSLDFSHSPSPAPSCNELVRTPSSVNNRLNVDYLTTPSPAAPFLSPHSQAPQLFTSRMPFPGCASKMTQWNLDSSIFGTCHSEQGIPFL